MNRKNIKQIYLLVILVMCWLFNFSFDVIANPDSFQESLGETSFFVTIHNIQLHYHIWFPEESVPKGSILLLHGLGGSTFSWRFVAPFLAKEGYLVVVPDLPGFGLSQRKPAIEQSYENRAKIIWEFLDHVSHPDTDWHLVGHSMGGGIVVSMALQRPSGIQSLILVDSSIDIPRKKIRTLFFRCKLIRNVAGRIIDRFLVTRKRVKSFLYSAYGRKPTEDEIEGYYQPLNLKNTHLTFSSLLKKYKVDNQVYHRVSDIASPVLLLWGETDEWIPQSEGEKLLSKIPSARLVVIEDASHCPMETHSECFNHHLIDFLRNH